MKKILFCLVAVVMAIGMASCGKEDYKVFVGTWGVERIVYYNIDFQGQPIPATLDTFLFTPGDMVNGIDLVFRDDRTGEMRDRSRDTLYIPVYENDVIVDTNIVICPDTTLVSHFTYSYHDDDATLFMTIDNGAHSYTYNMPIEQLGNDKFIYVNEYDKNYVEKAWLVRLSTGTRDTRSSKSVRAPRKEGSLFGTIF